MTNKTTNSGLTNAVYGGLFSNKADSAVSSTSYSVSTTYTSKIDDVESMINELTKKPEVRVDQRSALNIDNHMVYAYYYKDGFFTDSKRLIPAIKSIEVFDKKAIKMTFVNGDVQTATVQNGDPYFFEDGLMRCIVKEMIGKEGTAVLGKLLSYATNFYNKAEADKKKKAADEAQRKAASEKNYKKLQKHWEKKKAKERENRIQEMAEAIVRAEEMKKR